MARATWRVDGSPVMEGQHKLVYFNMLPEKRSTGRMKFSDLSGNSPLTNALIKDKSSASDSRFISKCMTCEKLPKQNSHETSKMISPFRFPPFVF